MTNHISMASRYNTNSSLHSSPTFHIPRLSNNNILYIAFRYNYADYVIYKGNYSD